MLTGDAILPQLDNAVSGKPLAGRVLSPANKGKECVWPEASLNDQSADPVSDIEKPVNNFDVRWFFKQYRCVEIRHSSTPPLSIPEQAEGAETLGEIKSLTSIKPRFRQTNDLLRRAVSETTRSGTNDNWHPLDAA